MPTTDAPAVRHSFAELSQAVLGRPVSIVEAFDLLAAEEFRPEPPAGIAPALWLGSVGYERHKDSAEFAQMLRAAGVERLIDVRELPISRRRGYAKTALGEAMKGEDIEYVHMRDLGNPKPYRDLYKSGKVEEGRRLYTDYLQGEQRQALELLASMLPEKKTALMCVEHDSAVCHRTVIVESLRTELGLELDIAELA
jgi:uncharacterized protein (DUF488 family)